MVLGPEFLQQTTEKVRVIQDRMRATQSRQKSYADKRRRPLEFEAGDHVFLRVTPTGGIGRALKSKKLTLDSSVHIKLPGKLDRWRTRLHCHLTWKTCTMFSTYHS